MFPVSWVMRGNGTEGFSISFPQGFGTNRVGEAIIFWERVQKVDDVDIWCKIKVPLKIHCLQFAKHVFQ